MRVLPHMTVVAPIDSLQAEKAVLALATHTGPAYIRLAREKTPIITTAETPFSLAKAQIYRPGNDVTIVATGTMVYHALMAAETLEHKHKIDAEVIAVPVVKPIDTITICASARRTGAVLTAEEAQVAGGLGGAVAEALADHCPVPVSRIGINDRFGESGTPAQLMEHFGLTAPHVVSHALELIKRKVR
jgi:transketolase